MSPIDAGVFSHTFSYSLPSNLLPGYYRQHKPTITIIYLSFCHPNWTNWTEAECQMTNPYTPQIRGGNSSGNFLSASQGPSTSVVGPPRKRRHTICLWFQKLALSLYVVRFLSWHIDHLIKYCSFMDFVLSFCGLSPGPVGCRHMWSELVASYSLQDLQARHGLVGDNCTID